MVSELWIKTQIKYIQVGLMSKEVSSEMTCLCRHRAVAEVLLEPVQSLALEVDGWSA